MIKSKYPTQYCTSFFFLNSDLVFYILSLKQHLPPPLVTAKPVSIIMHKMLTESLPSNSQAVSLQPKHSSWHKTFPIKMYTNLLIRALDGMTHFPIMFLKYGLLVDHTSFGAVLYNSLTLNRGYIIAKRFSPVFSLMPFIRFLLKRDFLLYNKDSLTEFLMKNFSLGNTCRLFSPTFVCFHCMWSNTIKEKSLTNSVTVSLHYDFSDVEVKPNDH